MTEPYLIFRIRRDCLLRDTLDEVVKYSAQQDLSNEPVFKRPLNVEILYVCHSPFTRPCLIRFSSTTRKAWMPAE